MSQQIARYRGLDGLRGIAALIVMLFHGTNLIHNSHYVPTSAFLAVDFFFMLSGFVIAYSYDRKLTQTMTWKTFMTIRLIRLYPMILLGTAFGVTLFMLAQSQKHELSTAVSLAVALGSFALVPAGLAVGFWAYPANIAAWSLFFELFANALYGSRFGRLSNERLTMLVLVAAIAMLPMAYLSSPYLEIGFGNPQDFLLGFVRVTYPFWSGVLIFRLLHRLTRPRLPIVLISTAMTLLLLAPLNNKPYDVIVVIFGFPLLILFGANSIVSAWTAGACAALGRLSYPLYLVHVPIFLILSRAAERMHVDVSAWILLLGGSVSSIVAAVVLVTYYDEPVRRWLSSLLIHHTSDVKVYQKTSLEQ